MLENIVILSTLNGYNRQGFDLAETLQQGGLCVHLFQYGDNCSNFKNYHQVKFLKPYGKFSKFHVLLNELRFLAKSFFYRKDLVICIASQSLLIGSFYKLLVGARLIYYAIECRSYNRVENWIVRNLVDKYIDVEDNRRDYTYRKMELKIPSFVLYNYPRFRDLRIEGGKLREYLRHQAVEVRQRKIFIYAGSYQTYAMLENIVEAARRRADKIILVLMVAWGLPAELEKGAENVVVIKPVRGADIYDWLSDADCALLPYESTIDFNVMNCSPQKIFDCYVVGVPFIGSDRPLIRKILSAYQNAGVLCDYTRVDDIVHAFEIGETLKTEKCGLMMKELYREKFNYDINSDKLIRFVTE